MDVNHSSMVIAFRPQKLLVEIGVINLIGTGLNTNVLRSKNGKFGRIIRQSQKSPSQINRHAYNGDGGGDIL